MPIQLPFYWQDELKDILLTGGFNRVIEKIEYWLEIEKDLREE